ncbi:hypothetical protein SAMN05428975_3091 [Mucilaginibacter sp. OK268]|uniref:hypothetical protein n=1 Tax=Mucilaginibacter sp. OK268 TaxID=1881048 RepID=UPI0008816826|nr:hypothetical protein [Mucilaginibacter sp. OK268]SDP86028.1 hypothetical protein SAMN05428975_3091 [Mucilaginibacter sp. OK268]
MDSIIDHNRLIDHRNEDIFKKVQSKFELSFEPSYNGEHSVYTIGNSITFYIPIGVYSADMFTHELLHAYIDYHEAYIGGNFKNTMWQSNILKQLFDLPLAEHITNSIAHTLMLPLYLEMGFDRSMFLLDYHEFKTEHGFLSQIARYYKQGALYNLSAIRNFIGKCFAFKCDPNSTFNYNNELQQLRKIDSQLYQILENYFLRWARYDFTADPISEYREINADFYAALKPWMNGKRFG